MNNYCLIHIDFHKNEIDVKQKYVLNRNMQFKIE